MSSVSAEIREIVVVRAHRVCEYCLIAEADAFFRFQVEHIISRKHGGLTELNNLALSCVACNRFKGSDIATLTPKTGNLVQLYNPRTMRWLEHFRINEAFIEPLTEIGEATVRILRMNFADRVMERTVLCNQKRFPNAASLLMIMEH